VWKDVGQEEGGEDFNGPNPCHYILSRFKWGGEADRRRGKKSGKGGGRHSFRLSLCLCAVFPSFILPFTSSTSIHLKFCLLLTICMSV
jgi:hypothetical protein